MSPELSAFVTANGTVLILVVGALAAIGLVQWRKVRIAEQEHEYKKALLEKGTPAEEIEKATAAKAPARRGLVDQFNALSGGAKAGIICGTCFFGVVTVSCIAGAIQSHAFWSNVREQRAYQPPQAPPALAPAPTETPPVVEPPDTLRGQVFYLDLKPVVNQKLTDVVGVNGHTFAGLAKKNRGAFAGVPFQVGPEYVRLKGKNRPELPKEVADVRVGFKFDKLHILHGTEYGAHSAYLVPDGTEIGRYRVKYTDGAEQTIPVVYGYDVRDSWNWDKSKPVTRGKVAWTGTSPGASKEGVTLRLYLTTWENPRTDAEVASIDFISTGESIHASPNLFALTAERATK